MMTMMAMMTSNASRIELELVGMLSSKLNSVALTTTTDVVALTTSVGICVAVSEGVTFAVGDDVARLHATGACTTTIDRLDEAANKSTKNFSKNKMCIEQRTNLVRHTRNDWPLHGDKSFLRKNFKRNGKRNKK
jgi:hypothetical protein